MNQFRYSFLKQITNKWSFDIIHCLNEQPAGFNQLLRDIDGVSRKILSDRLKSLERNGLITKTIFNTYSNLS